MHITRAAQWFDGRDRPIDPTVWLEVARGDHDLRESGYGDSMVAGAIVRDPVFDWANDDSVSFGYSRSEGNVVVKGHWEPAVAKTKAIAAILGAKVQGDEGEEY